MGRFRNKIQKYNSGPCKCNSKKERKRDLVCTCGERIEYNKRKYERGNIESGHCASIKPVQQRNALSVICSPTHSQDTHPAVTTRLLSPHFSSFPSFFFLFTPFLSITLFFSMCSLHSSSFALLHFPTSCNCTYMAHPLSSSTVFHVPCEHSTYPF